MIRATWNGRELGRSDATVVVEDNHYFPADALSKDVLETSDHTSECPWKGTAHYFHVVVDGQRNENAAWYYPEPRAAAAEIRGRIAFWKGVEVEQV